MLNGPFKDASFGPFLNLQILIYYSWKSFDLNSVWAGDSRSCQFSFLSRVLARLAIRHTRAFGVGIPNYPYWTMLVLALPQIYKLAFYL